MYKINTQNCVRVHIQCTLVHGMLKSKFVFHRRVGRRTALGISLLLSGVCCVILGCLPETSGKKNSFFFFFLVQMLYLFYDIHLKSRQFEFFKFIHMHKVVLHFTPAKK